MAANCSALELVSLFEIGAVKKIHIARIVAKLSKTRVVTCLKKYELRTPESPPSFAKAEINLQVDGEPGKECQESQLCTVSLLRLSDHICELHQVG